MNINTDFSQRIVIRDVDLTWKDSPIKGVYRKMFDRIGDEVARATTLVRYDPESQFSAHVHSGGEEFFVIDGVFQDEHGEYPMGSYVRNPPGSEHTPRSKEGCIIFVKLWQFENNDRAHFRLNSHNMGAIPELDRPGVSVISLYHDTREDVCIEIWQSKACLEINDDGGVELFVLTGDFDLDGENFRRGSWLRLPRRDFVKIKVGHKGARVWIKRGHLRFIDVPK
jgi:anti-sigma factor ChrR (cupin superfamily)